jgi:AraC-like DNA-binding protein
MKRAAELFVLESRRSRSPLVEQTWWTRSEPEDHFISVAAAHWEIVVTQRRGTARVTVRGPETRATAVPIPRDAGFFGVRFAAGTFMPSLPPGDLVDSTVTLPVTAGSFRLGGTTWQLPGPEDADAPVFVQELAREGLLVHDPVVADALSGDIRGWSTRSVERRVARATGLNRGAIARIRRAERAVELLSWGMPPADVAARTGYADQSHLTRSLRHLVGQSPAQIGRSSAGG